MKKIMLCAGLLGVLSLCGCEQKVVEHKPTATEATDAVQKVTELTNEVANGVKEGVEASLSK